MAKVLKQGVRKPWKAYQTYALDLMALKLERRRVDAPAKGGRGFLIERVRPPIGLPQDFSPGEAMRRRQEHTTRSTGPEFS